MMARVEAIALSASVPVKIDLHLTVDNSNFEDVGEFHRKSELPSVATVGTGAAPLHADDFDQAAYETRLKFMREDVAEFVKGWKERSLVQLAGALIESVYAAMGTAHLLGLPWQELWDEVQRANMAGEQPDLRGILERHGFVLTWELE